MDTAPNAKTFATGGLTYTISGLPSPGKSLLFQKSNGKYEVIVWNNVENWNNGAGTPITIGATNVTVTFPTTSTINTYDPTFSSSPQATVTGTSAVIALKDYPMIVEAVPIASADILALNLALTVDSLPVSA
jgi:hypothetical protein